MWSTSRLLLIKEGRFAVTQSGQKDRSIKRKHSQSIEPSKQRRLPESFQKRRPAKEKGKKGKPPSTAPRRLDLEGLQRERKKSGNRPDGGGRQKKRNGGLIDQKDRKAETAKEEDLLTQKKEKKKKKKPQKKNQKEEKHHSSFREKKWDFIT